MNRHKEHTPYNAADILRYLSGKMDREETRMLERAVLDDELLADAIEGYRLMRQSMSDETILQKIHPEEKQEKTPVIYPVKRPFFQWLGYAAAAVMIVGGGWWLFDMLPSEQSILPVSSTVQDSATAFSENSQEKATTTEVIPAEEVNKSQEGKATKDAPGVASVKKVPPLQTGPAGPAPAATQALKEAEAAQDAPTAQNKMMEAQGAKATRTAPVAPRTRQNMDSTPVALVSPAAADMKVASETRLPKWTSADTLNAAPLIGWIAYERWLNLQTPAIAGSPGTITLTILTNGSIGAVMFPAHVTDTEKKLLEAWIRSGPGWKNTTGKEAKASISWH